MDKTIPPRPGKFPDRRPVMTNSKRKSHELLGEGEYELWMRVQQFMESYNAVGNIGTIAPNLVRDLALKLDIPVPEFVIKQANES